MAQTNLGSALMEIGRGLPLTLDARRKSALELEELRRTQGIEDEEEKRKREKYEQEQEDRKAALEAIGKYNRNEAQTSIGMAEKAGPDAWATAPRENLQKISEGQVLGEMGMSTPLGIARGYGITANPSEPAQKFVNSLKDEAIETKGKSGGILSTYYNQRLDEARKYYTRKFPGMSEGDINNMAFEAVQAPSFAIQTSKEGLEKSKDLSEAKKLGGLTDDVKKEEADLAAVKAAAGTTAKLQAEKTEGKVLPSTGAEKLGDFGASMLQMNELMDGLKNPDSPQGPIAEWRKINPYDWKAQGKQQLIAATKQMVGKALEGGVLRKEDEIKYEKILPKMGDTYESAELKTQQIVDMLDNAYKAKMKAFKNAGYDVSKFPGTSKIETDDLDMFLKEVGAQ